jgi:hypothetical protein
MATSRPFAYNLGGIIPGTEQVGDLSVGTPTSGFTTNPQYWNGPDEELGYVIAYPVPAGDHPTPVFDEVTSFVGFKGTKNMTNPLSEATFVELTNDSFNQSFTTGNDASTWLTSNGYWNSWVLPATTPTPTPTGTPASVTPTPTPTGTPASVTPTPTPSVTPTGNKSLVIYARDVATTRQNVTLYYTVNYGPSFNIPGATATLLPITCTQIYTITGLSTADVITINTNLNCVIEGTTGVISCPSIVGSSLNYTYTMDAPSTQAISLTVDTSVIPG